MMIDIIDDTDNIDRPISIYSVTFLSDSQSHKSQPQGHKFTTRNAYVLASLLNS